jgi:hypothetical protein
VADDKAPVTTGSSRKPNGQFAPGKSGNAKGRRKGSTSYADLLRRIGALPSDADPNFTKDEYIAHQVYAMAQERDKWAIDHIIDRTVGKPVQHNVNENTELPAIEGFTVE